MKSIMWIMAGILTIQQINAQRIFPGAEGFGTDSRGAYSGNSNPTVLIVDTLAAGRFSTGSNRGTFEWCLTREFPRIILFEVGGVIDYRKTGTTNIPVNQPYLTVYGQTAPDPGITLIGSNIALATHNVLFQHITIRFGDDTHAVKIRDCFSIFSGSHHIVVDHCSFSWSQDEVVGISSGTHDITVSNCIVAEPLVYSLDATSGSNDFEPRRTGYAFGLTCDSNLSLLKNLIAYGFGRNPPLNVGSAIVINNFIYKSGPDYGIQVRSSVPGAISIVGNVVLSTEKWKQSEQAGYFGFVKDGTNTGTKVFLSDNICQRKISNPSTDEWTSFYDYVGVIRASSSPLNLGNYSILPAVQIEAYIKSNSGARFWKRDYHDERIISNVINRRGSEINSPDLMPAKAYNRSVYEGLKTSSGNMRNGYNWSSNPQTITVNDKSISLNANYSTINDVLAYLNANLPDGVEAIDHPHPECFHIIFQTITKGAGATITVSGNGLAAFGIPSGTYYGSDGVGGWPVLASSKHKLSLPLNEHSDNNSNGFTNLEEWAYNFTVVETSGPVNQNHPPEINDQNFEIVPDASETLEIGTMSASDPDPDQVLTFQIESGNDKSIFVIDPKTGILSFKEEFSVAYPSTFLLTVMVSDNGQQVLSDVASVKVLVQPAGKSVYIDPSNEPDELQNGSYEHPFNSWSDVTWLEGYTYLQKSGTVCIEESINIGVGNVRLGSFGDGAKPVIKSTTLDYVIRAFEKSKITIGNLNILAPDAISCIYFIGESSSENVIENCVLEAAENGIIAVNGNDMLIKYNLFKNSNVGINSYAETTNIYYNIFRNNNTGITILSNLSSAEIYNNVFYNNSLGVANSYSTLKMYNNIFYLYEPGFKAIQNTNITISSDNNLYYPEQNGFIQINGITYANLDKVRTTLNQEVHSINKDPLFSNAYYDTYTVSSSSPTINAGRDVGLSEDFASNPVPGGGITDIGLFETESSDQLNPDAEDIQLKVTIYPNPSTGRFKIRFSEVLEEVALEIKNAMGIIIFSQPNYTNTSEHIDISSFPKGMYLVSITKNSITMFEKAIIH